MKDCGCIKKVNKTLKKTHESMLVGTIRLKSAGPQRAIIATEKLLGVHTKVRPPLLEANFCPFCGKDYNDFSKVKRSKRKCGAQSEGWRCDSMKGHSLPHSFAPPAPSSGETDPRDAVVAAARDLMDLCFGGGVLESPGGEDTFANRLVAALDALPPEGPRDHPSVPRSASLFTRPDDGFGCCGGNDETPPHHCSDCPVHPWTGSPPKVTPVSSATKEKP